MSTGDRGRIRWWRAIALVAAAALCVWIASGCLRAYDTAAGYRVAGAIVFGIAAAWLLIFAARALLRRGG